MAELMALAPTTRYPCLVDGCDWHLDEQTLLSGELLPAPTVPEAVEHTVQTIARARAKAIDAQLAAHLAAHSVLEWATTISRLRSRVAELEQTPATAAARG